MIILQLDLFPDPPDFVLTRHLEIYPPVNNLQILLDPSPLRSTKSSVIQMKSNTWMAINSHSRSGYLHRPPPPLMNRESPSTPRTTTKIRVYDSKRGRRTYQGTNSAKRPDPCPPGRGRTSSERCLLWISGTPPRNPRRRRRPSSEASFLFFLFALLLCPFSLPSSERLLPPYL